jgi:hypothetical protein
MADDRGLTCGHAGGRLAVSWIFVSFLGSQPGATVAALSACAARWGAPARVRLYATRMVRSREARLGHPLAASTRDVAAVDAEIVPLETDHPTERQFRDEAEELRREVREARAALVVFAKSGLPEHALRLGRALRDAGVGFVRLLADADELICRPFGGAAHPLGDLRFPISDIGLARLLGLHGLTVAAWRAPEDRRLPESLADTPHAAGPCRVLDAETGRHVGSYARIFERRGFLHTLERYDDTSRARRALRRGVAPKMQGLRPFRAFVTSNPAVLRHCRAERVVGLTYGSPELAAWLARDPRPPGGGRPGVAAPGDLPPDEHASGSGGDASVSLATVLSKEPASTLLALQTHRPGRCLIFYDSRAAACVETKRRMEEILPLLDVGKVTFVATDHLGSGIGERIARLAPAERRRLTVQATPGTKEQREALAFSDCGEVWHLRGDVGVAEPLFGPRARAIRGVPAPVRAQVVAVGGRLLPQQLEATTCADLTGAQRDALRTLALALSRFHAVRRRRSATDDVPGVPAANAARLTDPEVRVELGANCVRVSAGGVSTEIPSKSNPGRPDGDWLEWVVADTLVRCGAMPDAEVGLRWDWPERERPGADHQAEVDVVARFMCGPGRLRGARFVAVSCKAGKLDAAELAEEAATIRAHARTRVDHFALPILVAPGLDDDACRRSARSSDDTLLVNAALLADTTRFAQALEWKFRVRSTVAP